MKVVVDANIVFSAILNTNGKIGDLLINSKKHLEFIAPDFLRKELYKHRQRIQKISGLSADEVREIEFIICNQIQFISEQQIRPTIWYVSEKLLFDIDPNDTPYVAFAKQFRCKIWSGDKRLIKGLSKKGFHNTVTTEELFEWRKIKLSRGA
ncbi:MAG: PIN domain-containing protein [Flavobacteriales bacterium]|jgi:predicted nucleic acid-binding protein